MKYLIIGAGAMGSVLAGYMTRAGIDVTLIARGENLLALQDDGLVLHTPATPMEQETPMGAWVPRGTELSIPVKAVEEADYDQNPDVVIVAVKSYSLDEIFPLLDRVCRPDTVVLPMQNSIGIAERIAAGMTRQAPVIEGVAYVACERLGAGEVRHKLDFFRIVLGPRVGHEPVPQLQAIADDFAASGATALLSDNMLKSELTKFVRIAALSGTLAYYGGTAGDIMANPERLDMLRDLATEVTQLADAAGCPLEGDPVGDMLEFMKGIYPGYRSSLKVDLDNGRPTELQDQVFDVIELGKKYGLAMEAHQEVGRKFGYVLAP